ncbi:MAG: aldehyde dehydrogenase family protein [Mycobacterium sp.]
MSSSLADPLSNTDIAVTPMTIGGKPTLSVDGTTIDAVNPATGVTIGRFPSSTAADVDNAVAAGRDAFALWKHTTPDERAAALHALADVIAANAEELATLDVADNGSPIQRMRHDVVMAVEQLRYYAGLVHEVTGRTVPGAADRVNYSLRQPYGLIARIIPFNHPFMFASSKLAAPLAAGNTVIIKPSEHTSLSALRLGELTRGLLPDGVVNVVTGYGAEAGDAIVRHPQIRRLAFIGAADTGRAIQAAAASVNVKHVTLELGGKNPLVIFDDADLDQAVTGAVRGMNFTWQGQSCGSTSRLLVQRSIYPELLERLTAAVNALRQGEPDDESTDTGALVNRDQYEKVQRYIAIGKQDGARLITGGNPLTDGPFANGFFVAPTVFADVDPHSRLAQEEVFGPILAVMPFDDYDDALEIANGVRYGLTASVFTTDLRKAHRFARDVEAGYVWVNEVSVHINGTEFGGVKDSGLGREEGVEELLSYTQAKNIHVNFG